MKIVITSNTGAPHKYLWSKVLEGDHEVYVLGQTHLYVDNPNLPKGIVQRVKSFISRYFASSKGLKELSKKARSKKMNSFFSRDEQHQTNKYFKYDDNLINELKASGRYFEYSNIKVQEAVDKINSIKPDILIVQGGKILPADFFNSCSIGTIHMHGGYVPWYRGGRTWYSNFMNDDLVYIGPTVQEIDTGTDTGNIIHQHTLKIESDDTPLSLYAKTCVVGVEIILNCIKEIERTGKKLPSTSMYHKGFCYSSKSIKAYEDRMVYLNHRSVIDRYLKGKFHYKPNHLYQNSSLQVDHPFVKY